MEVVANPHGERRLGDVLQRAFRSGEWDRFTMAVAFVKRSGTRHLRDDIRSFVRRGGSVRMCAGVDSGGTSYEGLRDLLVAGGPGTVRVFHNGGSSSFHPKLYVFSNERQALVSVGSGNLTEGGLFTNYELGLSVLLDRSVDRDERLLHSLVADYFESADPEGRLNRVLDQTLLDELHARGMLPFERSLPRQGGASAGGSTDPFDAVQVPAPPPGPKGGEADYALPDDLEDPDIVVSPPAPVPGQSGRHTAFVMTLQRTDVGVGQTSAGTSRRSPEIFIPLAARDHDPQFWDWPTGFTPDPTWSGSTDAQGRGKMDRFAVPVQLGGAIVPITFWYNPDKRDLRLRSEELRSAGAIGDILYMERSNGRGGFAYYADVVPQGTNRHAALLPRCTQPVRNSRKLFGYF